MQSANRAGTSARSSRHVSMQSANKAGTSARSSQPTPLKASHPPEETTKTSFKAMLAETKARRQQAAEERCYRYVDRNSLDTVEQALKLDAAVKGLFGQERIMTKNHLYKLCAARQALRSAVENLSYQLDEAVESLEGLELATRLNTIKKSLEQNNKEIIEKDRAIEELLGHEDVKDHIREAVDMQAEVYDLEELLKHYTVLFYRENPTSTIKPKDIVVSYVPNDSKGDGRKTRQVPTYERFMEEFETMFERLKHTPELDELVEYLSDQDVPMEVQAQVQAVPMEEGSSDDQAVSVDNEPTGTPRRTEQRRAISQTTTCLKCAGPHELFDCDEFEKLQVRQRLNFAKNNPVCFNCLRTGHLMQSCKSDYLCNICTEEHHTLLHDGKAAKIKPTDDGKRASFSQYPFPKRSSGKQQANKTTEATTTARVSCDSKRKSAFEGSFIYDKGCDTMSTPSHKGKKITKSRIDPEDHEQPSTSAQIADNYVARQGKSSLQTPVSDNIPFFPIDDLPRREAELATILGTMNIPVNKTLVSNERVDGRAVLNSASPISIVTEGFCKKNDIPIERMNLAALSNDVLRQDDDVDYRNMTGMTTFFIPLPNGSLIAVIAYLFWQGIPDSPSRELNEEEIEDIFEYDLADEDFDRPRAVDILLGIEVVKRLIEDNHVKLLRRNVTLTNTQFGYVVTGTVKARTYDNEPVSRQARTANREHALVNPS